MDDDRLTEALFTRRRFLRTTAGGLAAAGIAPILAACGGDEGGEAAAPPPAEPAEPAAPPPPAASTGAAEPAAPPAIDGGGETLKMWWWGEQEAIGIQQWVDETIAQFQDEANYVIDPLLMDTSQVIPQFTTAAAAGEPADIQFVFNGIYHMENTWLGYIQPLNGLVSDDTLAASGATALSIFQGQQYRVGFYIVGFGLEYDKAAFETAGLDPDSPPTTWDAFLDACDKIKSTGIIPLSGGIKDGFFGEWYFVNTLTQNLNSPADALNLFIGELDWREPQYHEHWVKLQELYDNGFINDDINSLELYQGIQLTETGKAAMTINTTAALPAAQEILGDRLGYMIFPTFGTGSMAGIPITDTQGFCIPTDANDRAGCRRVPRVHAHGGSRQRDVDDLAGAAGGREVRLEPHRRPVPQERVRDLVGRRAQRVRRRPHADALLDGRDVRDLAGHPRRQAQGRGVGRDRRGGHREVEAAESRHGRELHDLGARPGESPSRSLATEPTEGPPC